MRQLQLMLCVLGTVVTLLLSNSLSAAENGLVIPRIDAEPTLADFADMSPSSALARSMNKVENFTQREPDDGDPATQSTEVYIGYDQQQLHIIFLAFDARRPQFRQTLVHRRSDQRRGGLSSGPTLASNKGPRPRTRPFSFLQRSVPPFGPPPPVSGGARSRRSVPPFWLLASGLPRMSRSSRRRYDATRPLFRVSFGSSPRSPQSSDVRPL